MWKIFKKKKKKKKRKKKKNKPRSSSISEVIDSKRHDYLNT